MPEIKGTAEDGAFCFMDMLFCDGAKKHDI